MAVQHFFSACGGREPIRIAADDAQPSEHTQPVIVCGSHRQCDLHLANGPEQALLLALLDGCLYAHALDSSTPIIINGKVLTSGWLDEDGGLQIGPHVIRVENSWQPGAVPLPQSPLTAGAAADLPLAFESTRRGRAREQEQAPRLEIIPKLVLVGRREPARFKIAHPRIAPVHALLIRTPTGAWISNLSLERDTSVNGAAIHHAPLRAGDRVRLGPVELITHAPAAHQAVIPAPAERSIAPPSMISGPPHSPPGQALQEAPLPSPETAVGTIIQQVAQFQQQTFEQFREMLGSMTEMFGTLLNEHRQFVREEFARLERRSSASEAAPSGPTLPSRPTPPAAPKPFTPPETITPVLPPAPGYSAPPPDVGLHTWLQQQIQDQLGNLEQSQQTRWQKLVEKFRKK